MMNNSGYTAILVKVNVRVSVISMFIRARTRERIGYLYTVDALVPRTSVCTYNQATLSPKSTSYEYTFK